MNIFLPNFYFLSLPAAIPAQFLSDVLPCHKAQRVGRGPGHSILLKPQPLPRLWKSEPNAHNPASFFSFSSSSSTAEPPFEDPEEDESPSFDAPKSPFIFLSSSSTALAPSSIRNCFSMSLSELPGRALPPTEPISAETSADASNDSTFSSIRVKASIEVEPVTPLSMSLTFWVDSAVRARAIICSFLDLASRILASSACIPSYSLSTLAACVSICAANPSAVSTCCCLRFKASFAKLSFPF
mmetsp:Transcript_793/g.1602  ORF Transcript_793/g.1602 Transcript_793/m.1602 type:complete len:242 (-) Transcript_793:491-1216(-)